MAVLVGSEPNVGTHFHSGNPDRSTLVLCEAIISQLRLCFLARKVTIPSCVSHGVPSASVDPCKFQSQCPTARSGAMTFTSIGALIHTLSRSIIACNVT